MRGKLVAAAALLASPLLWPTAASATVVFSAGGVTICSGTNSCAEAGTIAAGGLNFTGGSGDSNSPGTAALAEVLSSTVSITNPDTVAHTVTILIGDTGYTAPTTPPPLTLESAIGDTVVVPGAGNLLSYRSCINAGAAQNVCPGSVVNTAFLTPSITTVGSNNSSNTVGVPTLASGYGLTEEVDLTLSPGSQMNFSASSRLEQVIVGTPEPASLTLLGSALIGLGWAARRRRKSL